MPNTHYDTNLSDAAWKLVAPLLPPPLPGGRPRTTDVRAVVNGISIYSGLVANGGCSRVSFPPGAPFTTLRVSSASAAKILKGSGSTFTGALRQDLII